jgi:hypothetical protein
MAHGWIIVVATHKDLTAKIASWQKVIAIAASIVTKSSSSPSSPAGESAGRASVDPLLPAELVVNKLI